MGAATGSLSKEIGEEGGLAGGTAGGAAGGAAVASKSSRSADEAFLETLTESNERVAAVWGSPSVLGISLDISLDDSAQAAEEAALLNQATTPPWPHPLP